MITINFKLQLPQRDIIRLLQNKGYNVENYDFGHWATEHHNRPVWREDIAPGVIINAAWSKLPEAFQKVYQAQVEQHLTSIFSNI